MYLINWILLHFNCVWFQCQHAWSCVKYHLFCPHLRMTTKRIGGTQYSNFSIICFIERVPYRVQHSPKAANGVSTKRVQPTSHNMVHANTAQRNCFTRYYIRINQKYVKFINDFICFSWDLSDPVVPLFAGKPYTHKKRTKKYKNAANAY